MSYFLQKGLRGTADQAGRKIQENERLCNLEKQRFSDTMALKELVPPTEVTHEIQEGLRAIESKMKRLDVIDGRLNNIERQLTETIEAFKRREKV